MRRPLDEDERKTIADVEDHGWHVVKVLEDDDGPAFDYTVGLQHSFGHPELIVVGLPLEVAHAVLNVAGQLIRRGVRYSEGPDFDDILENRACVFRTMPESRYRDYLGWALWFYDGASFPALQLIWPDPQGRWPWDPDVAAWFRETQMVIADQKAGD